MWKTTLYDTSKLTVELGRIVEQGVNIWDFDYPSYYTGEEKTAFEQKVIDHYRFNEIGSETVGRWLHHFRTRIREIMPYYLQLYKSQETMQAIEDPFGNVDVTETYEETRTGSFNNQSESTTTSDGTTTSNGTNSDTHIIKFSDTPQGTIENIESYMTTATLDYQNGDNSNTIDSTDNVTQDLTGSGTTNDTVKHTFTKKGNQGVNTYAHDMKELRETFLNIDMMIINELRDLFLLVY